jgi:deoxyadenosine/deoxycytidine kinase
MYIKNDLRYGLVGFPHVGKGPLKEAITQTFRDEFLKVGLGNVFIPEQVKYLEEKKNPELVEKFYRNRGKFAARLQRDFQANRAHCQKEVENSSGYLLQNSPPAAERAIYMEANKDAIGEDFACLDNMSQAQIANSEPPDIILNVFARESQLGVIFDRIEKQGTKGEASYFRKDPSLLLRYARLQKEYMKTCPIPVINIDATHPAFGKDHTDKSHLETVVQDIVRQTREMKRPPRFPLWQWDMINLYQAQDASRRGRNQLRRIMAEHQYGISSASVVSGGKSTISAMIADSLDINLSKELSGDNNQIDDKELLRFLTALGQFKAGKISLSELVKPTEDLQDHLVEERPARRDEYWAMGKSFIQDRDDEEDKDIFWKLFHEVHGSIRKQKYEQLKRKFARRQKKTKQPDLYVCINRSGLEAKQMSIERGRGVEQEAWSLEDMEYMSRQYIPLFQKFKRKVIIDMVDGKPRFDSDREVHRGWLWQEMLHELPVF